MVIDFSLSLQEIIQIYGQNPIMTFLFLMKHGGLLVIFPFFVKGMLDGWLIYVQNRVKYTRKYVLLSINVPKDDEQSMKAVEQIYAHLYGIKKNPTWTQKYLHGYTRPITSLEIESDGGYIQFYVRCWVAHQDVIEAAIYAQYPDAEIQMVAPEDDYTKSLEVKMIEDKTHDLYGSELIKAPMDDIYCIRHWRGWEHSLPGKFIDPMAALLEIMSRMQPGEHVWYQIMIQPGEMAPINKRCQAEIDHYTGDAKKAGNSWIDFIIDIPLTILKVFSDAIFGGGEAAADKKDDGLGRRIFLVDWEREAVTELDMVRSRWPYNSKIRFLYWAKKEKFNFEKGRRGMMGAIRQYRFLNSLEEGRWTKVDLDDSWFFDNYYQPWKKLRLFWRKQMLILNYKGMDMERGEHYGFNLSLEELASLFHFPQIDVRAPFVQKAESRRVEPPTQLSYQGEGSAPLPTIEVDTQAVPAGEEQIPSLVPHPQAVQATDSKAQKIIPKPGQVKINYSPEQTKYIVKKYGVQPEDQKAQSAVEIEPASEKDSNSGTPPNLPFV